MVAANDLESSAASMFAFIVTKVTSRTWCTSSLETVARLIGDVAFVNVHYVSSVQQLIVRCHESQCIRCVANHALEDSSLPSSNLHNDGSFQRSVRDP